MPNPTYKYSNGVDFDRVLPVLIERVKWLSDNDSKSGRYFDDGSFHALVNESLLRNVQKNNSITDQDFDAFKVMLTESAVIRALTAVFSRPEVVDHSLVNIITDSGFTVFSEIVSNEFAGYEICVAPEKEITFSINRIVGRFSGDVTIPLYLYVQGYNTPIWTENISFTGNKYDAKALTDCIFSYSLYNAAYFYFGYKPSELSGGALPISEIGTQKNTPYNYSISEILSSIPFTSGNKRYIFGSVGLNPEIISFRDNTDKILSSPSSFDELIGLIHAAIIIENVLFSERINPEQRSQSANLDKLSIQMDLTGSSPLPETPRSVGLRGRINEQIKKVKASFEPKTTGVQSLLC